MIRLIMTGSAKEPKKIPMFIAHQLRVSKRLGIDEARVYHNNALVGKYYKKTNKLVIDIRQEELFTQIKDVELEKI